VSKQKAKEVETQTQENPDVVIVKTATAPKLSPRGEGGVTYQVGRVGDDVYIRIEKNHGGGSCSKEWVKTDRLIACISPAMRRGEPFKSDALAAAFVGKSQCNSGFLVASLRDIGVFSVREDRKGMSVLTGDLDAWEKSMREAAPLLDDDGQPLTAKLHAEPKETKFRAKEATTPSDDAPQEDDTTPASEDASQEDEAKPKRRLVRIRKKLADELGVTGESETTQADAGESMELGSGIDPAVA
jgi:hypothetical protein